MGIFVSTGTRNARKKLEGIFKPDSKTCLDSFFRTELDKLKTKPSVQEILTEVQNDNSNVYKFAKFLTHEGQQLKNFQEAIKLQAKSAGTNKQGLFNTLIFNSVKEKDLTDPNVLKALKPKLKAFLLAKKDADIVDDATSEEEKVANDDKTSRRKKHEDIFAKLKSSRLSNVLKVFMVLVLWDYIKIKEEKTETKDKSEAYEEQKEDDEKKPQDDAQRKKEETLEKFLYNKENNYMPSPQDVIQHAANNCYMLGILVSLAEKNPQFIKEKLIKLQGNDIIITLHDYKEETIYTYEERDKTKKYVHPTKKYTYKLSESEIKSYSDKIPGDKHKANWVFAVEIAFAKLLRDNHEGTQFKPTDDLRYVVLNAKGEPSVATTVLTGKQSKYNILPPFKDRKTIRKFPEGAKYNDYCIKIRNSILKHLKKSEDASGLMVATFDELSSPAISENQVYKLIKEKPKSLKNYERYLGTSYTPLAKSCIELINGETTFAKSGVFNSIDWDIYNYLKKHINDLGFEKAKQTLIDAGFSSPEKGEWYRWFCDDHPEFALETYELWRSGLIEKANERDGNEFKVALYEQFKELMEGTITFAESKCFDIYLKDYIAPYLSKKLEGPEYDEFRKKAGLVSSHAYAILNCFEDPETHYWYVTLQNTWGKETRIDYTKSKRAKTVKFPPDPKPGAVNVFNMELAHFCKYLRAYSYEKNPK